MRLSKDLLNKAIVTIDNGSIVGYVKDIYLTPGLDAMAGIHLKKEGLSRRRSLLIPAGSVVVFGVDVVLIDTADAVTDDRTLNGASEWVRLDKLQGREVDTPGGTRVGTIGDVVLDGDGTITGYALSRVLVEGPIAESRIIDRSAVIENGNSDGIMTINIGIAEHSEDALDGAARKEEALGAIEDAAGREPLALSDATDEAMDALEAGDGEF